MDQEISHQLIVLIQHVNLSQTMRCEYLIGHVCKKNVDVSIVHYDLYVVLERYLQNTLPHIRPITSFLLLLTPFFWAFFFCHCLPSCFAACLSSLIIVFRALISDKLLFLFTFFNNIKKIIIHFLVLANIIRVIYD